MALFVLRKLILQTRMRSHPVGLDVWFLVGPFVYFHTSCVRTMKALARLRGCAGSPEPSLVAYMISTIISWAGSITNYLRWNTSNICTIKANRTFGFFRRNLYSSACKISKKQLTKDWCTQSWSMAVLFGASICSSSRRIVLQDLDFKGSKARQIRNR